MKASGAQRARETVAALSVEEQWAALYARGVCPREVALAVDYCYGTQHMALKEDGVSPFIREFAQSIGYRVETEWEWRQRAQGYRIVMIEPPPGDRKC